MKDAVLKIGCCGFPVAKNKYAERFCVGEVQQTFYEPPQLQTLESWRSAVPDDFEFTLKAWQLITHRAGSPTYRRLKTQLTETELSQCGFFRFTAPVLRAWEVTVACAQALRARHVLFQCPASFLPSTQNVARLRHFFSSIKRHGLRLLWEPRGDWPAKLIRSLCVELDLLHAVDPFSSKSVTPKLLYFRLHGIKGFRHVYSDVELEAVRSLASKSKTAYVLFNNIKMWNDAIRFDSLANPR